MGRGTPSGGRGTARNNNNAYGNRGGGQNSNGKPDVSALGLVSPLGGGAGLSSLSALHSTVGVGGLGGLQQAVQLGGLLGGGTVLTGGVSNELAGLCALNGRIAVTRRGTECDASSTSTTGDGGAGGGKTERG